MDYKTLMNEDTRSFSEFYEEVMNDLAKHFELDETLMELLKEKRKFGLEKYKEFSFQSSFENAVKAPTLEHLREEMIDGFNYTLHEIYKRKLLNQNSNSHLTEILKYLAKIWYHLTEIETKPQKPLS